MSTLTEEHPRQVASPLWLAFLAGGVVWVAIVAWFLFYSLGRATVVAAEGIIAEPTSAQVGLAYAMAIVFALPGVGLVVYGLARRRQRLSPRPKS